MRSNYLGYKMSTDFQNKMSLVHQFMKEEVYPIEEEFSKVRSFRQMLPLLNSKRDKVKNLGLWLPQISKEYGGMGLTLVEHGLFSEVLGRSPYGHYLFNCQAPDAGNMEILIEYGTEEQKEKWLFPLLKGEIRSCFSIVEPDCPGSNPTWIETTAEKDGNDYIINGHKWFTSSAEGSSFAIVMAVTNPNEEGRHDRASQIIVPTNSEGYNLVRNIPVMGSTEGDDWASHGEILYKNCRVPQTNRLGEEGEGFMLAQQRLGPGRIHHCMRWLGICERAFDMMCQRAVTREVAPGRTLSIQRDIQNWIAESRAEINAARLLTLDAAFRIDLESVYEARVDIALIKFYVANVLQTVLDRAIQIHGGLGVTDDTPLALWYSHERAARIYDGPDEVHKMFAAKRIFRQYS